MSDDYRAREHDHLVEPVFGGLGVEREPEPEPVPRGFRAGLRRLWRALLSLLRPSRPAGGR